MDSVTKTITKHSGVDPDKSNVDLSSLQSLFLFIFSNVNPFIASCTIKGHTYLDKPAALSYSFGRVCLTFLVGTRH